MEPRQRPRRKGEPMDAQQVLDALDAQLLDVLHGTANALLHAAVPCVEMIDTRQDPTVQQSGVFQHWNAAPQATGRLVCETPLGHALCTCGRYLLLWEG